MTSEAYVWVYLPGDTRPTVCGLYTHAPTAAGTPVGTFVYGRSYLANPDRIPLDPVALPLRPMTFSTTVLNGVFGAINDAMPDDWGRYVIDKLQGVKAFPVGYMLATLDDSIGNLAFSAASTDAQSSLNPIGMDLLPAAREALLGIEQGQPVPKALAGRLRPNTAMGGARPKLTVEHDGRLWLAKFPSARDDQSLPDAKLEAAMLALGALCGINTAKAQLALGDVLLVERFDRAWVDGPEPGWRRDSFLSARTIFNASAGAQQTYAAGGYGRLATELVRYSADPQADQKALFRRMVFNVCISNTDDHDRNHGVLADDQPGCYRLSPAYDLLPRQHSTLRKHHAMTLGGAESLGTRENLLVDGAKFGLSPTEAEVIVKEVELGVAHHWHECLRAQGLSASAVDRLKSCFDGIPLTANDLDRAIESRRNPR
jgi:serine/threonine-protein kinase HipA